MRFGRSINQYPYYLSNLPMPAERLRIKKMKRKNTRLQQLKRPKIRRRERNNPRKMEKRPKNMLKKKSNMPVLDRMFV